MLIETALRAISLLTDLALVLTLNLVGSAAVTSRFVVRFDGSNLFISVALSSSCNIDSAKGTLEL